LFATLNVPANNNNYLASAGGNSEFEDRQIANRDWLHRLQTQAQRERKTHIVLFCDGNPLPDARRKTEPRDGYVELRQQLKNLAEKSGLKIVVIQGSTLATEKNSGSIIWNGQLGYVNLSRGINMIAVDAGSQAPEELLAMARQPGALRGQVLNVGTAHMGKVIP
jgi:hypothetical protein